MNKVDKCHECGKEIPYDEVAVRKHVKSQMFPLHGTHWLFCAECGKWEPFAKEIEDYVMPWWHESHSTETKMGWATDEWNKDRERMAAKPCEGCGRLLAHPWRRRMADGHHACDDKCARKALRNPYQPPRPCDQCGEEYQPKRSDQRFCSGKCRVAAHRAKQ